MKASKVQEELDYLVELLEHWGLVPYTTRTKPPTRQHQGRHRRANMYIKWKNDENINP